MNAVLVNACCFNVYRIAENAQLVSTVMSASQATTVFLPMLRISTVDPVTARCLNQLTSNITGCHFIINVCVIETVIET